MFQPKNNLGLFIQKCMLIYGSVNSSHIFAYLDHYYRYINIKHSKPDIANDDDGLLGVTAPVQSPRKPGIKGRNGYRAKIKHRKKRFWRIVLIKRPIKADP